jgi:perosamine synthetase
VPILQVLSTVEGGVAVTNDPAVGGRLAAFYAATSYPAEALIEKLLQNVLLDYYSFKHPKRLVLEEWTFNTFNPYYYYSTSIEEYNRICPAGYFARMPAPLAALGRNQLRKIDRYNELRRETARYWDTWCDDHNYRKPLVIDGSLPVFVRYPVLVEAEKKMDTTWAVDELGVELGVWFTSNLHPAKFEVSDCPNADKAVRQCVNFPGIRIDDIAHH